MQFYGPYCFLLMIWASGMEAVLACGLDTRNCLASKSK